MIELTIKLPKSDDEILVYLLKRVDENTVYFTNPDGTNFKKVQLINNNETDTAAMRTAITDIGQLQSKRRILIDNDTLEALIRNA